MNNRFLIILFCMMLLLCNINYLSAQENKDRFIERVKGLIEAKECKKATETFENGRGNFTEDKEIKALAKEVENCEKHTQTTSDIKSVVLKNLEYIFSYEKLVDVRKAIEYNSAWEIIQNKQCEWLTIEIEEEFLWITLEENTSGNERKCSFKIKGKGKEQGITITQEALKYISLDKSDFHFQAKGGELDREITANCLWSLSKNGNDWCKVKKNNASISIACEPNTRSIERSFTFNVYSDTESNTITVKQEGVLLEVSSKNLEFKAESSRETISINTNLDKFEINDTNIGHGFSISAQNSGSITIAAEKNHSVSPRNGKIIITAGEVNETVNFSQVGEAITLSLSDYSITLSGKGGSKTVSVNTNAPSFEIKYDYFDVKKETDHIRIAAPKNDYNSDKVRNISVKAGNITKEILVKQEKFYPWARVKDYYHTIGFGAGYISKYLHYSDDNSKWGIFEKGSKINGYNLFLRYDPYFAPQLFGLGLHTGLFYQYYESKSEPFFVTTSGYNEQYVFKEHVLNVPIHLNYRIDFDEKGIFGIFFHCGLNLDFPLYSKIFSRYYIHDYYGSYGFNIAIGYGFGFHIQRFVFEYSGNRGLRNFNNIYLKEKFNSDINFTLTVMLNYKKK